MNSPRPGFHWTTIALVLAVGAGIGAVSIVAGASEELGPYPFILSIYVGGSVSAVVAIVLALGPQREPTVRRFVIATTVLWTGAAVLGSGLGLYRRVAEEDRTCKVRMTLCERLIPALETHRRVHGQLPTTLGALDPPTDLPHRLRGSGVWFFSDGERFGFAVSGAGFLAQSWNFFDSRQARWLQDVDDGEPDAELAELQRLRELGEKL